MDFTYDANWQAVQAELAKGVPTNYLQLMSRFWPQVPGPEKARLQDKRLAIELAVNALKARGSENFDLFDVVLPSICKSAAAMGSLFPDGKIPQLMAGTSGPIILTRQQAHSVLACGFLGGMPRVPRDVGELDFTRVVWSTHPTSIERVICQLHYFDVVQSEYGGPNGFPKKCNTLCFERICVTPKAVPNWAECDLPVAPAHPAGGHSLILVDDNTTIEDSGCQAQVDFANEQLMIGAIIPSMTQEEVLFSIRPECFLSLPLFNTLQPEEAVVIYGAKRFVKYRGYLETFQYVGHYKDDFSYEQSNKPMVIAIDAIVNRGDQFQMRLIRRDLVKAFAGYAPIPHGASIATGNWGCGVFRGDPELKFIQQLMSIAATNSSNINTLAPCDDGLENEGYEPKLVQYCTFHKPALAAKLTNFAHLLFDKKVTVAQSYRWLADYSELLETHRGGEPIPSVSKFFEKKVAESMK